MIRIQPIHDTSGKALGVLMHRSKQHLTRGKCAWVASFVDERGSPTLLRDTAQNKLRAAVIRYRPAIVFGRWETIAE